MKYLSYIFFFVYDIGLEDVEFELNLYALLI
jgi:hypothetical protein